MSGYNKLKDIDFKDKRVLLRAELDVPLENGVITDDTRIRSSLPTIKYLLDMNVKQIIICAHLGRPNGKDVEHSLKPVAIKLSEILKHDIKFIEEYTFGNIPEDKIILLENTRFNPDEKNSGAGFGQRLATFADIYVNDAFSNSHRKDASIYEVPNFIRSCAGFGLEKEMSVISSALENPERPFILIQGGAKVHDKIELLNNLLPKVDRVLIGGAMVFTFYRALGYKVGKSLIDEEHIPYAKSLLLKYPEKIVLPKDILFTDHIDGGKEHFYYYMNQCPVENNFIGVDIGLNGTSDFGHIIRHSKTIIFNGPMGIFEKTEFSFGTKGVLDSMGIAKKNGAKVIVGGGDSAAAVNHFKLADSVTHISTGGGASLELFSGKKLAGIEALEKSKDLFG